MGWTPNFVWSCQYGSAPLSLSPSTSWKNGSLLHACSILWNDYPGGSEKSVCYAHISTSSYGGGSSLNYWVFDWFTTNEKRRLPPPAVLSKYLFKVEVIFELEWNSSAFKRGSSAEVCELIRDISPCFYCFHCIKNTHLHFTQFSCVNGHINLSRNIHG